MSFVLRNTQSCIVKPHGIDDQLPGPYDSISEQFFIGTTTPLIVILLYLNASISRNRQHIAHHLIGDLFRAFFENISEFFDVPVCRDTA
ncbi:hypothetical protein DMX10_17255 [Pseudomonas sp. 57B-090624]|nr:hypothetical protein DMX10_17255 [Pseudomonas sp. 57B-090624]